MVPKISKKHPFMCCNWDIQHQHSLNADLNGPGGACMLARDVIYAKLYELAITQEGTIEVA